MDCTDEYKAYCAALKKQPRPPGVQPDERTPIVLHAVIVKSQGFLNRYLKEWLVVSCPAYVYAHIFHGSPQIGGREVQELAMLGHEFTVKPMVVEIPATEFPFPDEITLDDGTTYQYIGPKD